MAKKAGRRVKLYQGTGVGATLVLGGREHGITINNEAIDITDKGDNGWRTLLDDVGVRSIDISFAGLMDGSSLLEAALGDPTALLDGYEVRIEGVGTVAGNFVMSNIEISTPHDDAVELSGTLQSSGVITFTAATP